MSNNPPVETLRDGALKASIFRNEGDNGPFFNTIFSKTYKDELGELRRELALDRPPQVRQSRKPERSESGRRRDRLER